MAAPPPTTRSKKHPYRWSQRWYDDPPIGTINLDGGRNPEIHIDNGEWQPLSGGESEGF